MSVFESMLYGIVSGFAEFLPVSAQGHQAVMMRLFGLGTREPLRDLLIHLACLAALLFSCRNLITRLRRVQAIVSHSRRKRTYELSGIYDLRLIKTAIIPMIILLIAYRQTASIEGKPLSLSVSFLINGVILLLPEYLRQANKTARALSGFDGILLGIVSGFSCVPGISRIGCGMGTMSIRGADRTLALNWTLLLSIPALIVWIIFDFVLLFQTGVAGLTFLGFLSYLLSMGFAFAGAVFGISIIRFVAEKAGFASFAYYSFGLAMFTFVLYLIA